MANRNVTNNSKPANYNIVAAAGVFPRIPEAELKNLYVILAYDQSVVGQNANGYQYVYKGDTPLHECIFTLAEAQEAIAHINKIQRGGYSILIGAALVIAGIAYWLLS